MNQIFVNTPDDTLPNFIDQITTRPGLPPSIFIYLEHPHPLGEDGGALLAIHIHSSSTTFLFEIYELGDEAFLAHGTTSSNTLRSLLESNSIIKVFFDISIASHALFRFCGICLQGVFDVQLTTSTMGAGARTSLPDLATCFENDLSSTETRSWNQARQELSECLSSRVGHPNSAEENRRLKSVRAAYCIQTTKLLPLLWYKYSGDMSQELLELLKQETSRRVSSSPFPALNVDTGSQSTRPSTWLRSSREAATSAVGLGIEIPATSINTISASNLSSQNNTTRSRQAPLPIVSATQRDTDAAELKETNGSNVPRQGQDKVDASFPDDYSDGASYSGSERDYTACSVEGCGYCGHCRY